VTTFNLRNLRLRSGEQFVDEQDVELEPLALGGQTYAPVPATVPAQLSVTRASTGTVFELGFRARLHGPCYRCLDDAVLDLPLHLREYEATNADSDELRTPYVTDDKLDLSAWARDAVVLALPDQILCRDDCAGLCALCGKDLNAEPHSHDDEQPDSRWAALAELRERL
jgi:uncharacterized protein